MNKVCIYLFILFSVACTQNKRAQLPQNGYFGEIFSTESCIETSHIKPNMVKTDSIEIIVCGQIGKYCKGEGCWLSIENPNGKPILIENKNKSFIVPFNIDHKFVQAKGLLQFMEPNANYSYKLIATGVKIQ